MLSNAPLMSYNLTPLILFLPLAGFVALGLVVLLALHCLDGALLAQPRRVCA